MKFRAAIILSPHAVGLVNRSILGPEKVFFGTVTTASGQVCMCVSCLGGKSNFCCLGDEDKALKLSPPAAAISTYNKKGRIQQLNIPLVSNDESHYFFAPCSYFSAGDVDKV